MLGIQALVLEVKRWLLRKIYHGFLKLEYTHIWLFLGKLQTLWHDVWHYGQNSHTQKTLEVETDCGGRFSGYQKALAAGVTNPNTWMDLCACSDAALSSRNVTLPFLLNWAKMEIRKAPSICVWEKLLFPHQVHLLSSACQGMAWEDTHTFPPSRAEECLLKKQKSNGKFRRNSLRSSGCFSFLSSFHAQGVNDYGHDIHRGWFSFSQFHHWFNPALFLLNHHIEKQKQQIFCLCCGCTVAPFGNFYWGNILCKTGNVELNVDNNNTDNIQYMLQW